MFQREFNSQYPAIKTHKSHKVAELLAELPASSWPLHYQGYFHYFDQARYYEAHDVLEELWLGYKNQQPYLFLKGLIQLAGAFVHMQKKRIRPALRLYLLAWNNLHSYFPSYWGLQLVRLHEILLPYCISLQQQTSDPLHLLGAPRISGCLSIHIDTSDSQDKQKH